VAQEPTATQSNGIEDDTRAKIVAMSEQPSIPDLLPPEPPELVKWARWLVHYARYEGAVIKKAPAAFLIGVGAVGAIIYLGLQWHNAGAEATKDATIQNQQAHIATLEGELKGASPQLAAIEARRAATRGHLLEMYIAGGPLTKAVMPPPDLPKGGRSPEQVNAFVKQVSDAIEAWEKTTGGWLKDNLGPAAEALFRCCQYGRIRLECRRLGI
jgi:hypothetical protein